MKGEVLLAIKICITLINGETIMLAQALPQNGSNHQMLYGKKGSKLAFHLTNDDKLILSQDAILNALKQAFGNEIPDWLQNNSQQKQFQQKNPTPLVATEAVTLCLTSSCPAEKRNQTSEIAEKRNNRST